MLWALQTSKTFSLNAGLWSPLPYRRPIRLVFAALNAFAHLSTPLQQIQTLTAAHRMLAPAGLLILDLFNPLTQEYDERDRMVTLRNVLADPRTGAPIQQFEVWGGGPPKRRWCRPRTCTTAYRPTAAFAG